MIILFVAPVVFQLSAPVAFRKMPFWLISLMSVVIFLTTAWFNLYLMGKVLTKNNIRCGMPLVGIASIEFLIAFILGTVIIVQVLKKKWLRSKQLKNI